MDEELHAGGDLQSRQTSVGVVKYFCEPVAEKILQQLKIAHERDPDQGLDLSVLNVADTSGVFKKKRSKRSA